MQFTHIYIIICSSVVILWNFKFIPLLVEMGNTNNHKFKAFDLFSLVIYVAPFLHNEEIWNLGDLSLSILDFSLFAHNRMQNINHWNKYACNFFLIVCNCQPHVTTSVAFLQIMYLLKYCGWKSILTIGQYCYSISCLC